MWDWRSLVMLGSLAAAATASSTAHAQVSDTAEDQSVSPTAKGVIGGALLGAEVVMMTQAIAGVRPAWPYLVFGGAGAVAGGVGGYFVERAVDDGRVPLYMLAGGLALILPTVVLTLNATHYRAAEDYRETAPPTNTGRALAPVRLAREASSAPPPAALVDVVPGSLRMSLPVPEVRPVFSAKQRAELGGVPQQTEVRVPVLKLSF